MYSTNFLEYATPSNFGRQQKTSGGPKEGKCNTELCLYSRLHIERIIDVLIISFPRSSYKDCQNGI